MSPASLVVLPIINGKTEITLVEIDTPAARSSLPTAQKHATCPNTFLVVYTDFASHDRRLVDDFFIRGKDSQHNRLAANRRLTVVECRLRIRRVTYLA